MKLPQHWEDSLAAGGGVLIDGEAVTDRKRLEDIRAGNATAGPQVANSQVDAEGHKQPSGAKPDEKGAA
ncbi:MAG: hypothetical protein M3R07_08030, partial [Gemmatimonadota bacterium]|nr:hypothetical protein [Gemmatimonadota bacterium]